MARLSESDLLAMLQTDALGTSGTVTGGGTLLGVFRQPYIDVEVGVGVTSSQPTFRCRTSDVKLEALAVDDEITINSVAYRVVAFREDSGGLTEIILSGTR